jgi:hypothetical protein
LHQRADPVREEEVGGSSSTQEGSRMTPASLLA